MITNEEKNIIIKSCESADCFGVGRFSLSRDNVIDEGYIWTNEHEMFLFNYKEETK